MKRLVQKLKALLKRNKCIVDIIIFGSLTKGKMGVNDLDLVAIVNSPLKKAQLEEEIRDLTTMRVDLQIFDSNSYENFLWIALIREGYSVRHNKYLFEIYGIKPMVLYKYSLKELTQSKKVMFDRAIKNIKGIERLSNRVVLVPIEISGEFDDFLRHWNLDIETAEYGLLPLVRKEPI